MEIVINDTNILIDLYNAGLLEHCKKLDIEFRTLDVIMQEISVDDQRKAVEAMVADGTLKVFSLSADQIATVFEKIATYAVHNNLSAQDISVMVYAIDTGCRLLTGDTKLRNRAVSENVKVSGILYLTDMFSREGIISPSDMVQALEALLASNSRSPKKLIRERIDYLKSLISL